MLWEFKKLQNGHFTANGGRLKECLRLTGRVSLSSPSLDGAGGDEMNERRHDATLDDH